MRGESRLKFLSLVKEYRVLPPLFYVKWSTVEITS